MGLDLVKPHPEPECLAKYLGRAGVGEPSDGSTVLCDGIGG